MRPRPTRLTPLATTAVRRIRSEHDRPSREQVIKDIEFKNAKLAEEEKEKREERKREKQRLKEEEKRQRKAKR